MNKKRLSDVYKFSGFKPLQEVLSHPQHPEAFIVQLKRSQKKLFVLFVILSIKLIMTVKLNWSGIFPVEVYQFI